MHRIIVLLLLLTSIAAALAAGAGDSVGRLLLSAGLSAPAAALIGDPAWKGVALYSAQRWNDAAAAFRHSEAAGSTYNLGNALAQAGHYSAAIEAYEEALDQDPEDGDARANLSLLAALTKARDVEGPTAKSKYGGGDRRSPYAVAKPVAGPATDGTLGGPIVTSGGGGDLKDSTTMTLLENSARIGPEVDARSAYPDLRWLETLPDNAGRFLKLRLAFEHERRVDAGMAPPAGDPQ